MSSLSSGPAGVPAAGASSTGAGTDARDVLIEGATEAKSGSGGHSEEAGRVNLGDGDRGSQRRRSSISLGEEGFRAKLRRINIMDAQTGVTLFETVWKWRGNKSTDGTDALVATFYQFASSIDKTRSSVSRVIFELPVAVRQHGRHSARSNQNHLKRKYALPPQEVLEMLVSANGIFRVVLFHDVTRGGDMEKVDDLVYRVRDVFTQMFSNTVKGETLAKQIMEVYQSNPSDERDEKHTEIQSEFAAFENNLEDIIRAIGAQRNSNVSGLSSFMSTQAN